MRYDILLTIFPSYIQSVKCYDKNMYLLINRNNFNLVISLKDISEMFILTFFPKKKINSKLYIYRFSYSSNLHKLYLPIQISRKYLWDLITQSVTPRVLHILHVIQVTGGFNIVTLFNLSETLNTPFVMNFPVFVEHLKCIVDIQ